MIRIITFLPTIKGMAGDIEIAEGMMEVSDIRIIIVRAFETLIGPFKQLKRMVELTITFPIDDDWVRELEGQFIRFKSNTGHYLEAPLKKVIGLLCI